MHACVGTKSGSTSSKPASVDNESTNLALIGGVVGAVVVLLIIIIVIVVVCMKKREYLEDIRFDESAFRFGECIWDVCVYTCTR